MPDYKNYKRMDRNNRKLKILYKDEYQAVPCGSIIMLIPPTKNTSLLTAQKTKKQEPHKRANLLEKGREKEVRGMGLKQKGIKQKERQD